jgi:hypothetical protein
LVALVPTSLRINRNKPPAKPVPKQVSKSAAVFKPAVPVVPKAADDSAYDEFLSTMKELGAI